MVTTTSSKVSISFSFWALYCYASDNICVLWAFKFHLKFFVCCLFLHFLHQPLRSLGHFPKLNCVSVSLFFTRWPSLLAVSSQNPGQSCRCFAPPESSEQDDLQEQADQTKSKSNCSSLIIKCFSFDEVQVCLEEEIVRPTFPFLEHERKLERLQPVQVLHRGWAVLHSCSNQDWFISAWPASIQIFQEFQVLYKGIPGITGIPGVPSIPGIPSLLNCPQDSVWTANKTKLG